MVPSKCDETACVEFPVRLTFSKNTIFGNIFMKPYLFLEEKWTLFMIFFPFRDPSLNYCLLFFPLQGKQDFIFELQFNRNYLSYYSLSTPLVAGEAVLEHFSFPRCFNWCNCPDHCFFLLSLIILLLYLLFLYDVLSSPWKYLESHKFPILALLRVI